MPDNDILCPTCGHLLAFHKFDYGSCDAPLGGLTSKNVCGCPLTIRTYIQNLQRDETVKKFWKLEDRYNQLEIRHEQSLSLIAETIEVLNSAKKRLEFLDLKLKNIRELIEKNKPLSEWIKMGYRGEAIKLVNINEIISELEKDMENG